MAKIMKDTRQTIDVDTELEKIKKSNEKKQTKEVKKDTKKGKNTKKKTKKVEKKVKKEGFFKQVRNEMKKVKWPSKKDMLKYSIATIVFVVFFALFFYAIDLILAVLKEVS